MGGIPLAAMDGMRIEVARGDAVAEAAMLRHAVFVEEMGVDPRAERDRFDADATHLVLRDGTAVVGTLRLSPGIAYVAVEFDLSALLAQPRPVAEVGRMCLHPEHRGGVAGARLLTAAAERLRAEGVGFAVGTASLFPADVSMHMPALRALRDAALAPEDLRPHAHGPEAVAVDGEGRAVDMRSVPPLVKSYLRAGAWVGEGAWVDRAFGCVDVCLVLDLARLRLPLALRTRAP